MPHSSWNNDSPLGLQLKMIFFIVTFFINSLTSCLGYKMSMGCPQMSRFALNLKIFSLLL